MFRNSCQVLLTALECSKGNKIVNVIWREFRESPNYADQSVYLMLIIIFLLELP